MKKLTLIIVIALVEGYKFSFAQNTPTCPLTVADIQAVFRGSFQSTTPMKFGEVVTCTYKGKDYSVQISIQPAYGMKIADYHKQTSPKTVTWKPIPNDADGALIETRDASKDDLANTPAIAYIRKDKYVRLQVLGVYYKELKPTPVELDDMRNKLAKLKRVP